MKKLCIFVFEQKEIYACPVCFHQTDIDNYYCSNCGENIEGTETIDSIDDFKKVALKFERK